MDSIRSIMEHEGENVVFDKNLIKRLRDYNIAFINRNQDHIQYFGNVVTGVYKAKFKTSDRDIWFDTVLDGFDEKAAHVRIIRLPTLKPEWKRATDIMNMACLWIAHRFLTNDKLSEHDKQEGAFQALLILNIKFLTSLTNAYFSYPVNMEVARAVVDKMSNKYLLKQLGSWKAFLDNRSNDIKKARDKSSNYKAIIYFDDDKEIIDAVHDIQLRLRQTIKGVWKLLDEVLKSQNKISMVSNTVVLDGEQALRDIMRDESKYLRYIHATTQDKTRFIKEELASVVESVSTTMSPKAFRQALDFIQANAHKPSEKNIAELINETVLHSIQFLQRSPDTRKLIHSVGDLAARLRANYSSSTSTDPTLIKMRRLGYDVVKKATGLRNDAAISAVRTGVFMYLVLRTYSIKHYG